MQNTPRSTILVISASWQTRALLAAQIGEQANQDVVSAADIDQALSLIKLAGVDPALLVVDAGQKITGKDLQRLMEAKPDVPMVLVASRFRRRAFERLRGRSAAYLERPVSVGTIARIAGQTLEESA